MKIKIQPLLVMLLALPVAVQAQFTYITNAGNTITITGYTGSGGGVLIPTTINGLPVNSIGNGAFNDCENLTSVIIPDNVTSIGFGAFGSCMSLTNVIIGTNLTSIGSAAFFYCSSLIDVTIPNSVTRIEDYAFDGCSSLTNVTIGLNVAFFGGGVFYYCTGLKSVYFHGNAPVFNPDEFLADYQAIIYYLPGTSGWSLTLQDRPTALWLPQVQTSDGNFGVKNNQFGFNIAWASSQTVVVEACTNLVNPVWTPIATNTLTSDTSYFSDPQPATLSGRFYRLKQQSF